MPEYKIIKSPVEIEELRIDENDYRDLSQIDLINMLEQIFIINYFEHAVLDLKEKGLIHGPVHSGVGQKGVAAGIGCSLDKEDMISATNRAHHL